MEEVRTKYIWNCGNSQASIEMWDVDMARLEDDEFAVRKMLSEVSRVLGNGHDHVHIFRDHSERPEGKVIFECYGKKD